MKPARLSLLTLVLLLAGHGLCPAANADSLREIHRQLVGINTAPSAGAGTREAADKMALRLLEAGFDPADVRVIGPAPTLSALVARYRSPNPQAGPILLMAHLDVVEAVTQDWSFDPFTLTERDGWLYGLGSYDNKAGAAILVANFIRLRAEGFQPGRDFIMLLTPDEETNAAGLQWLLENHRQLLDAEFALNTDAGYVLMAGGDAVEFRVQTAEKVYATYAAVFHGDGGHSSLPRPDNAIYALAGMLGEVGRHQFPIDVSETVAASMAQYLPHAPAGQRPLVSALASGRLQDPALQSLPRYPFLNAQVRTTCAATRLSAGHAENALPQSASAVINCRILPQAPVDSARQWLETLARSFGGRLETRYAPMASPPSPLRPALMATLREVADSVWPGIELVPEMESGATDGAFTRNAGIPTYGISALESDPDDDRAHSPDERIAARALDRGGEFWYRLLRNLGADQRR